MCVSAGLSAKQTAEHPLKLAHEARGIGIQCHGVAPKVQACPGGKQFDAADARVILLP